MSCFPRANMGPGTWGDCVLGRIQGGQKHEGLKYGWHVILQVFCLLDLIFPAQSFFIVSFTALPMLSHLGRQSKLMHKSFSRGNLCFVCHLNKEVLFTIVEIISVKGTFGHLFDTFNADCSSSFFCVILMVIDCFLVIDYILSENCRVAEGFRIVTAAKLPVFLYFRVYT